MQEKLENEFLWIFSLKTNTRTKICVETFIYKTGTYDRKLKVISNKIWRFQQILVASSENMNKLKVSHG